MMFLAEAARNLATSVVRVSGPVPVILRLEQVQRRPLLRREEFIAGSACEHKMILMALPISVRLFISCCTEQRPLMAVPLQCCA